MNLLCPKGHVFTLQSKGIDDHVLFTIGHVLFKVRIGASCEAIKSRQTRDVLKHRLALYTSSSSMVDMVAEDCHLDFQAKHIFSDS